MDQDQLKQNLRSESQWLRFLYMIIFVIALQIAEFILGVMVLAQLIINLFSGESNENLLRTSRSFSLYVYHILQFLTYNSNERPYPFAQWPSSDDDDYYE